MKLNEILTEAPLPDDWDVDIFDERVPFTRRVRYAVERAKKIGAGSSRIAFEIPYKGRPTVLKIAKNAKGMAQNEYESMMLEDYLLKQYGIVIPLIDYDERSSRPTWIHVEKAAKAKPSDFVRKTGLPLDEVINVAEYLGGRTMNRGAIRLSKKAQEVIARYKETEEIPELIEGLMFLFGNYEIPTGDFRRVANWGIYKNSPVIVDIGLSTEVLDSYYK